MESSSIWLFLVFIPSRTEIRGFGVEVKSYFPPLSNFTLSRLFFETRSPYVVLADLQLSIRLAHVHHFQQS